MAEPCTRCVALEAENARLRQEIKYLKRRLKWLRQLMKLAHRVLMELRSFLLWIINEDGKVVNQKSGISPVKWQRSKGRHEVASAAYGSVASAIAILEQGLK
jgi:hypothetical protein